MKTIEVNLIGDLRQSYSPKKGSLPQKITKEAYSPQEARETLILVGVAGTAAIAFIITILTFLGCFGYGIYLDAVTADTENKIATKEIELSKAKKIKTQLLNEQKELTYQKAGKDFIDKMGINIPEVLQEMRAKIPEEVNLVNIKRSKNSILIKGEVSSQMEEPLKSISLFIINLNTMKPEVSFVSDAFLASTVNKSGKILFAITANYKDIEKIKETKKNNTKK